MDNQEIDGRFELISPVFVVGVPRSGTSMLWNILVRLPDFCGMNVPFWNTETSIFKKYVRNMQYFFEPNVWPFWFEYYNGSKEYFENFLLESCRSFLVNAAKARGARRILEKTPNHVECLAFIVRAFNDAKIVHIFRHPVDIYASMKKRALVTSQGKDPWLNTSIFDFGMSYNEKIVKAFDFPQNIFHVRYEDLTENPGNQMLDVCEFIDVDYFGNCIEGQSPIKEIGIFPVKSNVPIKNSGDWKGVLNIDDVDQLQSICSETMEMLGYIKYGG